jgi:hypothetical protein
MLLGPDALRSLELIVEERLEGLGAQMAVGMPFGHGLASLV